MYCKHALACSVRIAQKSTNGKSTYELDWKTTTPIQLKRSKRPKQFSRNTVVWTTREKRNAVSILIPRNMTAFAGRRCNPMLLEFNYPICLL